MLIQYNAKTDLLYLRFDTEPQQVINKQIAENITMDIGADDKIIGIEILDASTKVDLGELLPLEFDVKKAS